MKRLSLFGAILFALYFGMVGFIEAGDKGRFLRQFAGHKITHQGKCESRQLDSEIADSCGPRRYYLTEETFTGAEAEEACVCGFHMASLFEILDPTNLQYDATVKDWKSNEVAYYDPDSDMGFGPPSGEPGWVRTGTHLPFPVSVGNFNCDSWTTDAGNVSGSKVRLNDNWLSVFQSSQSPIVNWWIPEASSCSEPLRVWCTEDPR